MAGLTSQIESFLLSLLEECENGVLEIGRNDLADRFQCAPSQINYVLTTRFTPYKGYHIESRRGGRGCIRIIRLNQSYEEVLEEIFDPFLYEEITIDKARHILDALVDQKLLSERDRAIMRLAMDDKALVSLNPRDRNVLRASILKNMLLILLK